MSKMYKGETIFFIFSIFSAVLVLVDFFKGFEDKVHIDLAFYFFNYAVYHILRLIRIESLFK